MIHIKNIRFNKLYPSAKLPAKSTKCSAGYDIYYYWKEGDTPLATDKEMQGVTIFPGQRKILGTGIRSIIPEGYEGQIRSRSGIAAKQGLFVLNSPGTIDSDFRDEWKIILCNNSTEPFTLCNGDRIAQVVFNKIPATEIVELSEEGWEDYCAIMDTNNDRVGGLGSTGGVGIGQQLSLDF